LENGLLIISYLIFENSVIYLYKPSHISFSGFDYKLWSSLCLQNITLYENLKN